MTEFTHRSASPPQRKVPLRNRNGRRSSRWTGIDFTVPAPASCSASLGPNGRRGKTTTVKIVPSD